MNTPEKMKAFLDSYPSTDLADLVSGNSELYQQRTPLTIFDRLLKMEPSYYDTGDQHVRLADVPDFTSDQQSTRPANMLYLFQMLICKGAKVSAGSQIIFHTIVYASSTPSLSIQHSIRITARRSSSLRLASTFFPSFVFATRFSSHLRRRSMMVTSAVTPTRCPRRASQVRSISML